MTIKSPQTTIGQRLDALLATNELTQEEAAAKLGVSRFTVNQWIQGKRTLTAAMALRLEKVFDISAESLLRLQMRQDLDRVRRLFAKGKKATHD